VAAAGWVGMVNGLCHRNFCQEVACQNKTALWFRCQSTQGLRCLDLKVVSTVQLLLQHEQVRNHFSDMPPMKVLGLGA